jgi:hypothetical protein
MSGADQISLRYHVKVFVLFGCCVSFNRTVRSKDLLGLIEKIPVGS